MAKKCEIYQPLFNDWCDECGRPKNEHPFIYQRPEKPFDPVTTIENSDYESNDV